MMFRIPVITGLGLVTPLGASVEETWSALLKGRAIETHAKAALAEEGSRPRVDQLAIAAATEAFEHARWTAHSTDSRTALIVGTSKGAVTSWITPPPHITSLPYIAGGLNVCGVASTAMEVGRALGLSDGPRLTLSAACASGLNALIRAAMMIRSGEVDRALVVAAEASVHPLFSGSFKRLGVLPAEGELCRPLDRARSGFFISEAAAAVCLEARTVDPESECDALTARRPFAIVDRFALGGDATHITGSDPSGQPLRRILRDVAGFRQSSATPLRPIIHVMLSIQSSAEIAESPGKTRRFAHFDDFRFASELSYALARRRSLKWLVPA